MNRIYLPHEKHTDRWMEQQIDKVVREGIHGSQQIIHTESEDT